MPGTLTLVVLFNVMGLIEYRKMTPQKKRIMCRNKEWKKIDLKLKNYRNDELYSDPVISLALSSR